MQGMKDELMNWDKFDSLMAQTEAVVMTVNEEMLARFEQKKEFCLIEDKVVSDLLWAACDNFELMNAVRSGIAERKAKKREAERFIG
ncbi:MAG: hypothetical protein F9K32_04525 [Desulfobulbaceae bacterium]|nr:MAG: hypothetical protein F9K32_04525 [Desulfobulbaceae bacterium]